MIYEVLHKKQATLFHDSDYSPAILMTVSSFCTENYNQPNYPIVWLEFFFFF